MKLVNNYMKHPPNQGGNSPGLGTLVYNLEVGNPIFPLSRTKYVFSNNLTFKQDRMEHTFKTHLSCSISR